MQQEINDILDSKDEIDDVDLSISDSDMLDMLRGLRRGSLIELHRLRTAAKLNRHVENHQLAEQQFEQATKIVRQIVELDKEIKGLESKQDG